MIRASVKYAWIFALLMIVGPAYRLQAEDDAEALGKLNQAYLDAFNKQDIKGIAASFEAEGDFLMLTGDMLEGRETIVKGHAAFFANNPRAKISGKQLKRKFISPTIALSHGEWAVMNGPSEFPNKGIWTAVQVKKDGVWKYETIRLLIPAKPTTK